jgi:Xaa-Pro dipeptidase
MNRFERLEFLRREKNIDAFLFTGAASLKCFSGYFFNFIFGPSPFQILPAALIEITSSKPILLIADNEAHQIPALLDRVAVKTYSSYTYQTPLNFEKSFLEELDKIIKDNALEKARIGVEAGNLPLTVSQYLTSKYPQMKFVDVTENILLIRAIKDQDEIEGIRAAASLCDIGQIALLARAESGMTELELFSLICCEMEASFGTRLPIMADFVSGGATASGGGSPTHRIIQEGDLVLADLTPCLNGYWGDCCSTIAVGTATPYQEEVFKRVKDALDLGISLVRPGIEAKEVDKKMRDFLGDFPHHGGHGVGAAYHENPRIVPYNDLRLSPGMVIALEPAKYEKDFGIRLEHLLLVTANGCEALTKFPHCLQSNTIALGEDYLHTDNPNAFQSFHEDKLN